MRLATTISLLCLCSMPVYATSTGSITASILDALPPLPDLQLDPNIITYGSAYKVRAGIGKVNSQPKSNLFTTNSGSSGSLSTPPHLPTQASIDQNSSYNGNYDTHPGYTEPSYVSSPDFNNPGFGIEGGSFQFALNAEGYGEYSYFVERRDYAYTLNAAGGLALEFANENLQNLSALAATINTANIEGKYYLQQQLQAPYLLGGVNEDGMIICKNLKDTTVSGPCTNDFILPNSFVAGIGYGRIYNIHPRITLQKIERLLRQKGLIQDRIPHDVAKKIMLDWYQVSDEFGYIREMQYTFKELHDAGLLRGEVDMNSAYIFGQILNDSQLINRLFGADSRLYAQMYYSMINYSNTTPNPDSKLYMTFNLRDKRVFNLTLEDYLVWDALFQLAPRDTDKAVLGGNKMVVILPVSLQLLNYDDFYHLKGWWDLGTQIKLAKNGAAKYLFTVDGTYYIAQDSQAAIGIGGGVTIGKPVDKFGVTAFINLTYNIGDSSSSYVSYDAIGDALPFEVSLPGFSYFN